MQVAQYTFQSPSTSQVQVGRLDPNSVKQKSSESSLPADVTNQTAQKAEAFVATQKETVKPTITQNSIDIYA